MSRHPGLAGRTVPHTSKRIPLGRRLSAFTAGLMVALAMVAGTPVARAAAPGPTLAVTTTSLPSGQVPYWYSTSLSASNGVMPYSWTLTAGTLPPGLSVNQAGVISGNPSVDGTWTGLVFQVADAGGAKALSSSLSITIDPGVTVTTSSLPAGQVTVPYSTVLSASNGIMPYSWTLTAGTLPPGLTLNYSGLISGTPTVDGTWSGLVFQVADAGGAKALSSSLSITIIRPAPNAPPSLMGLLRDACTGLPITRGLIIGLQSAGAVGPPGSVTRPPGPTGFGFFTYPTLAGGSYQLSIQAPGYAPLGAASRTTGQPGLSLHLDESRTALSGGGALAEGLLLDLRLVPLNAPATGCRAALPPLFPAVAGRIVSNGGRGVPNLGVELQTIDPATGEVFPGTDVFGRTNRQGLFSLTVTNLGAFDEGQHQVVVYRAGRGDGLTVKLGDRAALSAPSGYQGLAISLRLAENHLDLAAGSGSSSTTGPVTSAIDVAAAPASARFVDPDTADTPTGVTPPAVGPRRPLLRRRVG